MKFKNLSPSFLILSFVIVALLFFVCGLGLGLRKVGHYKEALNYYAPMPEEVYTVDGEILSLGQDSLVVRGPSLKDRWTSADQIKLVDYNVTIDQNTKITRTEVAVDPSKSRTTTLTLAELQIGNKISLRSKENIAETTNLTATLIDLAIFPNLEE